MTRTPGTGRAARRAMAVVGAVLTIPACGGSSTPGADAGRARAVWSDEVSLGVWQPASRPEPPELGADGAGNVFAVWERHEDSTVSIVATRFDRTGGWSSPLVLGTSASSTPIGNRRVRGGRPRLAVARDGSALVAWVRAEAEGSSVALSRFVPEGGWSDAALPGAGGAGGRGATGVRAATDGDSRALLAWAVGDDVWAQELRSDTGWEAATVVGTDLNTRYYYNVSVYDAAVEAGGAAVVLWFQGGDDGLRGGGGLRAAIATDGRWGEADWALGLSRAYSGGILAGVDGSGTALLAWQGADPYIGIFSPTSRTGDAGGWSDIATIASNEHGLQDVVLAPDGRRIALLSRAEVVMGDVSRLSSKTFEVGRGWHDERPIAPGDTVPATGGRLTVGPDGTALAVWVTADRLRSARRPPSSGEWEEPLTIAPQSCGGALLSSVLDADGDATAVWASCGELRAARLPR